MLYYPLVWYAVAMLCCAIVWHDIPMVRYAMLRFVVLCNDLPCYAILCCVVISLLLDTVRRFLNKGKLQAFSIIVSSTVSFQRAVTKAASLFLNTPWPLLRSLGLEKMCTYGRFGLKQIRSGWVGSGRVKSGLAETGTKTAEATVQYAAIPKLPRSRFSNLELITSNVQPIMNVFSGTEILLQHLLSLLLSQILLESHC